MHVVHLQAKFMHYYFLSLNEKFYFNVRPKICIFIRKGLKTILGINLKKNQIMYEEK